MQGDSAIRGSKDSGATTATITRDWNPFIEERNGLPTVQLLSEVAKQVLRRKGKVTVKPHTTRLPGQQEDQKGITGERGDGSVTLVGRSAIRRGERGWMLTINSHGVKISIAGGVEEILCNPNILSFFILFLFQVLCIINYWEQRLRGGLAIAKKKPHPRYLSTPVLRKKPSTQGPMV